MPTVTVEVSAGRLGVVVGSVGARVLRASTTGGGLRLGCGPTVAAVGSGEMAGMRLAATECGARGPPLPESVMSNPEAERGTSQAPKTFASDRRSQCLQKGDGMTVHRRSLGA